jgi:DNA-binding LacI/PurR family transcriptional regulator
MTIDKIRKAMQILTGQNNRDLLPELIKDQILSDIHSGKLCPGDRLPGDRALAKANGWGRGSVIEALKLLEQGKYIERFPGRGTFVSEDVHRTISNIRLIMPFPEPIISSDMLGAENFSICMTIFQGMVSYAGKNNAQVLFQHFKETEDVLELQRQFELVKEFDGAVFIGPELKVLRLKLIMDYFPVGRVFSPVSPIPVHSDLEHIVKVSQELGIKEMADYLKSRDYKKIAIATGTSSLTYSDNERNKISILREKLSGYTDISDDCIFNIPTAREYNSLLPKVLEETVTAEFCKDFEIIICFNTCSISHIYRRLLEMRLIPGKDIDLIANCSARIVENMIPSVTHIEVPNFSMGELLCESIINEIKNKTNNKAFIEVDPQLITGESSRK